jgi:hypothetical protein
VSLSIRSPDYRNPRNHLLSFIHNDDGVTAILIIVERQLIGNHLGVGHGVGGITKPGSLVVFDRQGATHDVKEVSPHPVAP